MTTTQYKQLISDEHLDVIRAFFDAMKTGDLDEKYYGNCVTKLPFPLIPIWEEGRQHIIVHNVACRHYLAETGYFHLSNNKIMFHGMVSSVKQYSTQLEVLDNYLSAGMPSCCLIESTGIGLPILEELYRKYGAKENSRVLGFHMNKGSVFTPQCNHNA